MRGVEASLGNGTVTGAVTAEAADEEDISLGGTGEGGRVRVREFDDGGREATSAYERVEGAERGVAAPLAVWNDWPSREDTSEAMTDEGGSSVAYRPWLWELAGREATGVDDPECWLRRGDAGDLD